MLTSKRNTTSSGAIENVYRKQTAIQPRYIKFIKRGIWLYFFLLFFEGALRKWVLPGLATPLLIVRDPIALYIVLVALQKNLLPPNGFLFLIVSIGFLSIVTAVAFGHGSMIVAIYGARILLIHFPMIFVIGKVFSRDDVTKMGIMTLWIAIPMAILIAMQFYSPQSALVNVGVGGDDSGAGFSGAQGFYRPPGTFSFTNGTTLFFSFVAPFVCYFAIENKGINKLLLIGSAFALIAAIPLSISRALFFQVALTIFFVVIAVSRKPKYFGKLLFAGLGILLVLLVLKNLNFFQTGVGAFTDRFESANQQEGGVKSVFMNRILGGLVAAVNPSEGIPFFGYGIGMGTKVGAMLISGTRRFLISEGEWGRIVGELGLLLGCIVILVRISFAVKLAKSSYQRLTKGDMLPWLLLSSSINLISQGSWAQPTALGFSTLVGGLMLASFKRSSLISGVGLHPGKR